LLQWSTQWFVVVGMGREVGASTSNIVVASTLTLPWETVSRRHYR